MNSENINDAVRKKLDDDQFHPGYLTNSIYWVSRPGHHILMNMEFKIVDPVIIPGVPDEDYLNLINIYDKIMSETK